MLKAENSPASVTSAICPADICLPSLLYAPPVTAPPESSVLGR
ncbi:Putative protein of unknown function [Podospora comata]|uniref:Uncharacterized protein n=1 Tax=Podospora comata TaxID=48703 RepID=A0ABY6SCD9_PODCO|nr:Putative protein of unknown function [Podospora comata]